MLPPGIVFLSKYEAHSELNCMCYSFGVLQEHAKSIAHTICLLQRSAILCMYLKGATAMVDLLGGPLTGQPKRFTLALGP